MKKLVETLKVSLWLKKFVLILLCIVSAVLIFPSEGLAAQDCTKPPPAPQPAGAMCDPTLACFTITSSSGRKIEARLPQKPCGGNYVCRPHKTIPDVHSCQCAFGSIEMPLPGTPTLDVCKLTGNKTPFAALVEILNTLAGYITAVIVALGLVMTVIGGYFYMTAGGDGNKISTAKKIIGAALLGITLALVGWLVINTISPQFTQPPEPSPRPSPTI